MSKEFDQICKNFAMAVKAQNKTEMWIVVHPEFVKHSFVLRIYNKLLKWLYRNE